MAKVNKRSRWPISLAIIIIVVAASIALALTHRVPAGELSFKVISDGAGGTIVAWLLPIVPYTLGWIAL